jgi:asparagine synthase (glutamine-hydrolysing)
MLNSELTTLLTLRFNPYNPKHTFRQLVVKDFTKPPVNYSSKILEGLITTEITKFFKKNKPTKVAVPLSGGVDSTLIAKLVCELKPKNCKVYVVSMGFGHNTDEVKEAERIASEIGHNEFHSLIVPNVLKDVAKYVHIVGEPRWNTYYGYVIEYVKNSLQINTMITGDGGDELFGGYSFRYSKFLDQHKGTLEWGLKKALAYLESAFGRDYVEDQQQMFGQKVHFSWDKIVDHFRPWFENNLDVMNQFFIADFNCKLAHDYVPTNSALYDYYGVKGFTPLLQSSVIDYACRINPSEKYSKESGIGKLPLRAILVSKGLNKFMLPQKTGYGTDLAHLWQTVGKREASILIGEPLVVKKGLIRREWIDKHLFPEQTDVRYINKLLQIVSLEYFIRGQKK